MTDKPAAAASKPVEWAGDALGRKRYSAFLSNYIHARVARTGEPLTIALDASWGAGKTFFIDRWSDDLKSNNGGAIVFNAWKNDFSVEVMISFMAELSNGIKPLRDRISTTAQVADVAIQQAKNLKAGFRQAAWPVAAVVAKGMLAKLTGVAVDQVVEAIGDLDSAKALDVDWDRLGDTANEQLEKGLEQYFEKTLEAHTSRSSAIEAFKLSLESLVKTLQDEQAISGPLFVFVDELDRCRPDYAIKLLEGIKHLFAVKGVVFVIATNLDQLSKAVQAVYGGNFDGYSYLKRFFDFEFTLPAPDVYQYAQVLLTDIPVITERAVDPGLHEGAYDKDVLPARAFEAIANACNLNLRTQRQVWMIATAAATGIPANARVSLLWLFFLASLKHSFPSAWASVSDKQISANEFNAVCKQIGSLSTAKVKTIVLATHADGHRQYQKTREILLTEVLWIYFEASNSTIREIEKSAHSERISYPRNLAHPMVNERPNPFNSRIDYVPAIANYYELVKMAGQIS